MITYKFDDDLSRQFFGWFTEVAGGGIDKGGVEALGVANEGADGEVKLARCGHSSAQLGDFGDMGEVVG